MSHHGFYEECPHAVFCEGIHRAAAFTPTRVHYQRLSIRLRVACKLRMSKLIHDLLPQLLWQLLHWHRDGYAHLESASNLIRLRKEKLASGTEAIPRFAVDYTAIRPVSEAYAIKVAVEDRVQNLVGQVGELEVLEDGAAQVSKLSK